MTDPKAFSDLHAACAAEGTILFTLSILDPAAGVSRRAYTSHPVEYPVQGTKPMERDAWFIDCVEGRNTFVANTPEGFRDHFFDHALIESMGLGSAVNIPLAASAQAPVTATVNLLAGPGHFSAEKLARYAALTEAHRPAILAALSDLT
ncbi:GAF domain-containing protein [Xinfangfangia pollutisoli]|uniref:GAF domain-containing protein n=1 Tax=Xinfangfangia pollutisoli TaxID=2865960 RepID=UPI001CD3EEAD|nr:GAF domain-containing protein [Xinfangfangia pollutisoli]